MLLGLSYGVLAYLPLFMLVPLTLALYSADDGAPDGVFRLAALTGLGVAGVALVALSVTWQVKREYRRATAQG